MRIFKVNGVEMDIDNSTAIGITSQTYDIKQPGKSLANITNTFTIPATAKNLSVFGFANDPQSTSVDIYEFSTCNYWVDNEQLIKEARIRVNEIGDRISLFAFQKESVWDQLKLVNWPDFVPDFIQWLQDEKGLPSISAGFTGPFDQFILPYVDSSEGIVLPFYFGNLYNYTLDEGVTFFEDATNIRLHYWPTGGEKVDGGHFCVFSKTIFEYIEQTYDVDFLTAGGQAVGNIWDDPIAPKLVTPIRDLAVRSTPTGYYFEHNPTSSFLPLKDAQDKEGKTLNDYVNAFFQHFNVIKDDLIINNKEVIRLSRFDDLKDLAEVVDFSGRFSTDRPRFKPVINGYSQENRIKFKSIFEEGDELQQSRILTCQNKNIDASSDLFEIDSYINAFLPINGGVVPDLSVAEAFKTFSFFLLDDFSTDVINIGFSEDSAEVTATYNLRKAALYSLNSEYTFLDEIIDYPRFYEWAKWLTLQDIKDFQFFRQYFIQELGGSFFINKISGFNPQKANTPTKLELIKVSNKTPITPPNLDYWMDGVFDPFTDGTGDIFI